ncbi:MAG: hypothetical protein EOL87_18940, partial [Spartobacteria bacterium]|nr:hypothetical protein [Spartobacteria bacterium]
MRNNLRNLRNLRIKEMDDEDDGWSGIVCGGGESVSGGDIAEAGAVGLSVVGDLQAASGAELWSVFCAGNDD